MPCYAIDASLDHALLFIRFRRHMWTRDDIAAFAGHCRSAVETLLDGPGYYRSLILFESCHLQTQDIFQMMEAIVRNSSAERMALVADNPLARMQTKRLASSERVRIFDDADAAREWLDMALRVSA